MKILNTNNFEVSFQDNLEGFVKSALKIFETKITLIEQTFNLNISILKPVKAKIFSNRSDFFDYIKKISNQEKPEWLKGCFINGQIQILVNLSNEDDVSNRVHTLTHEFVHIIIKNEIYKKYNINRIRWLDESFACYIDGRTQNKPLDFFKEKSQKLRSCKQIDLMSLNDSKKLKADNFDAYDVFQIVGKYIFENNLENHYIQLLKTNPEKFTELSTTTLEKALTFIENL